MNPEIDVAEWDAGEKQGREDGLAGLPNRAIPYVERAEDDYSQGYLRGYSAGAANSPMTDTDNAFAEFDAVLLRFESVATWDSPLRIHVWSIRLQATRASTRRDDAALRELTAELRALIALVP